MKLLGTLIARVLLLLSVALAHADAVIQLTGPTLPAAGITTQMFTLSSLTGTSPGTSPCVLTQSGVVTDASTCTFENDITKNGVGLTIKAIVLDVPFANTGCGLLTDTPFSGCSTAPFGSGRQIIFFGGSLPFHADFSLILQGFPANIKIAALAAVPEPSTLVLFGTGLLGIWGSTARRKLRG